MGETGRVLVLGATGFFGGAIAAALEAAGHQVERRHRRNGGDLLDPAGLRRLIAELEPSAVVNAAGLTSPAAARKDPAACFRVNTGGVMNLLEACRQAAPGAAVVAISSAAVYSGESPFSEDSPTAGDDPYSASKLTMELVCRQYLTGYRMPVTVLRSFNLTGPGEPSSQATSEFALAALAAGPGGRAKVKVGEPATARDFTDVRDAARAVRLILESGATGTFNLCSGRSESLAGLAGTISALVGCELDLIGTGGGQPASGLLTVEGNPDRLADATGWKPEIPLATSLGDLLDTLRNPG